MDHAGDPDSQRRAAEAERPDLPIQIQFLGEEDDPICIAISGLDSSESYSELLELAKGRIDFEALTEVKDQGDGMSAIYIIDGRSYRISFSTRSSQGRTMAMAMIGEIEER